MFQKNSVLEDLGFYDGDGDDDDNNNNNNNNCRD